MGNEKKVYTFDDLKFKDEVVIKSAKMFFDNGYGVSVIYGDLLKNKDSYELAIIIGTSEDDWRLESEDDDSYQAYDDLTPEKVTGLMEMVQNFPPIEEEEDKEEEDRLKTFADLVFHRNPLIPGNWNAKIFFDNGYGVSVIYGDGAYGDEKRPYELAVLIGFSEEEGDWDICFDTPITADVETYLTEEDVTELMKQVQELEEALEA